MYGRHRMAEGTGGVSAPPKTAKLRLLIVEEEVGHLEFVLRALRDLEADVAFSIELPDALEKLESGDPDLVILDAKAPGTMAIAVCRTLAAKGDDRRPPLLLVTEYDDEIARRIALEVGADDRLSRPYVAFELRARIRALVRQRDLQAQIDAGARTLAAAQDRIQRLERLTKFLPPDTVEALLGDTGGDDFFAVPRRKEVTVLFSDIRNFTQISDQLEPEEVKVMLDVYLSEMQAIVQKHSGSVNKVMGDGLMAIFGDPRPLVDHRYKALAAGMEMQSKARALQAELHSVLPEPFQIGVGVNTGPVTMASLNCGDRLDYTCVGSTVNLAARMQALSTNNAVLAAASTYESLGAKIVFKEERREMIKGFAHAIRVAEILSVD